MTNEKYRLINNIMMNRGFVKMASGTNRVVYRFADDYSFVDKNSSLYVIGTTLSNIPTVPHGVTSKHRYIATDLKTVKNEDAKIIVEGKDDELGV